MPTTCNIYLAGEIHGDRLERIRAGVEAAGLPVRLTHPVTDHPASDHCGVEILGVVTNPSVRSPAH
jgi:hypothetical protein